MLIIALGIAGLAAFGFFTANKGEDTQIIITIGSGLMLFLTLAGIIAIGFGSGGTANIRVISILFFIASIVSNLIFNFFMAMVPYVIINGILLLLYILISYSIVRALK
jgi:hypothetical protein